jgi:signal transduction histidine kinase
MLLELSGKHILIVDDNPTNLKVLADILTEAGFDLAVATNGQIAIQQIQDDPPELILLDVLMPEMDGFETCKQIKENPSLKDIPVIFMTAMSDPVDKVKGLSLGAVDYITKPFETEELLARLHTHLQLRLLTKTLKEKNEKLSEALERLKGTQQQLIAQEKLATIGRLTAGIVHELRNPLNFIKNYGESSVELSDDLIEEIQNHCSRIDAEAVNYMKEVVADLQENALIITRNAQRAESVIEDMLMQSSANSSEPQLTYLNALLDQSLKLVYKSKYAQTNNLEIEIHKDYDETIGQVMLISAQISRAFINLIDNAFYALQKKQEQCSQHKVFFTPQLSLKTKKLDGVVQIRIRDNGIGIPRKFQEQIFRPFFSTKPTNQGTGLGLCLTHEIIVDEHGGSLTFETEPNIYTEFMIEIPR